MLEFLPKEVREGLEAARKRDLKRKSRLRVQVGEAVFPVLRFWHDGFALDADLSPGKLRGLVDVFDGSRHVFQCLIVASGLENGELARRQCAGGLSAAGVTPGCGTDHQGRISTLVPTGAWPQISRICALVRAMQPAVQSPCIISASGNELGWPWIMMSPPGE